MESNVITKKLCNRFSDYIAFDLLTSNGMTEI